MKKERRQELQTNILADRIGNFITKVRPYWKPIVGVIIVGIVAIIIWSVLEASKKRATAEVWKKDIEESMKPAEGQLADFLDKATKLEELAEEHDGQRPAVWLRTASANASLAAGMRQLYDDQAEARLTLSRAKEAYEDLLPQAAGTDRALYHRVLYGFAQTCEALSLISTNSQSHRSYLDQAMETYGKLAEIKAASGLDKLAKRRLELLGNVAGKTWEPSKETPDRQDWASWLTKQKFPMDEPSIPRFPGLDLNLPEGTSLPQRPLQNDDNSAFPVEEETNEKRPSEKENSEKDALPKDPEAKDSKVPPPQTPGKVENKSKTDPEKKPTPDPKPGPDPAKEKPDGADNQSG